MHPLPTLARFAAVLALSTAAAAAHAQTTADKPAEAPAAAAPASAGAEAGLAAVYSDRLHGRITASGQRYDRRKLTAAHKTLPFGTLVKVTRASNKRSVTLRINDRGPVQAGRILDISPAAARALGMGPRGLSKVEAVVVSSPGKAR